MPVGGDVGYGVRQAVFDFLLFGVVQIGHEAVFVVVDAAQQHEGVEQVFKVLVGGGVEPVGGGLVDGVEVGVAPGEVVGVAVFVSVEQQRGGLFGSECLLQLPRPLRYGLGDAVALGIGGLRVADDVCEDEGEAVAPVVGAANPGGEVGLDFVGAHGFAFGGAGVEQLGEGLLRGHFCAFLRLWGWVGGRGRLKNGERRPRAWLTPHTLLERRKAV